MSPPPTAPRGPNLSFSYVTRDGPQTFEALTYVGFRYLQIDDPGDSVGADQVKAVATHAAMPSVPAATFATGDHMLDAVWRLNSHSCLYCTHEHFVDTPTREKGQFVWDSANESEVIMGAYGDQNLSWQGLRDVARGQTRYWPDGQANEASSQRRRRPPLPDLHRALPRMALALLRRHRRPRHRPARSTRPCRRWPTTSGARVIAATGLLNGFGDGSNSDPVYGYDLNVTVDTTSNVLGVNAFRRIAQVAVLAGDHAGSLVQLARAAELTDAINARFTRPDGIYTDGLEPDGARAPLPPKSPTRWPWPTGSSHPSTCWRSATTWPDSGCTSGRSMASSSCRGLANAGLQATWSAP